MTTTAAASGRAKVPPRPPHSAMVTLLPKMMRDRLAVMKTVAAAYGDAVRIPLGFQDLYFFNNPDHAKHVLADNAANYHKGIGLAQAKRALGNGLLTSEGDLWREQRTTIQPAFTAKRLALRADAVAEHAVRLVARLGARAGRAPVDIRDEMTALTLGVLGDTLLDSDLGAFESIGEDFERVQDQAMFDMMALGAVPAWVPFPGQLRFRKARRRLQGIVDRLVDDRRANPTEDGDDVVSRLIRSVADESDPVVGRLRMRDELITLLLAGHETTASTLSWALHLTDEHPEVWDRLHAEAVEVLGDRPPAYADLNRLTYTSMVLSEVMRLYPPVWILPRRSLADDEVGGYRVPAGRNVMICPYTLHRHPGFWERPDEFDPDRFGPKRQADRPRYAYLPFGAGPRFCVGNNLGLMEATFVLAVLARELRLRQVPGRPVTGEAMLTLRVRGGLPMTVERLR